MVVAYATAEREALQSIFTNPDKFTSADPFLFMLAAIIVLLFGPGPISADGLLQRVFGKQKSESVQSMTAVPAQSLMKQKLSSP